jgi:hypothetical protein
MHDDFETLLKERFVPQPPTNLAERIIASARPRIKKKFFAGFSDIFADYLILPQPAYAMAIILFVGLATGFYLSPGNDLTDEISQAQLPSFMTADVSFYDGDFL